ncbi:transposase [Candidatus Kaiserbacteria bacterium]|nr:transposase [Candidatus Kaiserbacteria bacterium]USN92172.1 MAG: transposase [Candidatus Nomurabacteria bacterium]
MARTPRLDIGENYYHIINRANARLQIFNSKEDYELFEEVLQDAWDIYQSNILAYCVMPNHFHIVIKTKQDGEMSQLMKWFTQTHASRWHAKNKTHGSGSLYQGRYKSFIIQDDLHLLTVLRYVERNPLTAKLVTNPLDWKYSSVYRRYNGKEEQKKLLSPWVIEEPSDYLDLLTQPMSPKEIEKLEGSEQKSTPYGDEEYVLDTVERYGLLASTRNSGRPKTIL